MAGDEGIANWIASKLNDDQQFKTVESIGSGFLKIARKDSRPFTAVAIGIKDIVTEEEIIPLFRQVRPEFVVNVPSKVIWSGPAIDFIHNAPAAFGTLGELTKAAREESVCAYRNKNYSFFEGAFRQHTAVHNVTRVYDRVFRLHRNRGLPDFTVVLIDAYDMSAENVRNARALYGKFDAAVKMSSYGSITTAASEAAEAIGAETFKFGDLLRRLNKR